jgi:hypothetical protein
MRRKHLRHRAGRERLSGAVGIGGFLILPLACRPCCHDAQAALETSGAKLAMQFGAD